MHICVYADHDSAQGMAAGAAFTFAALLAGEQAQLFTAVRLKDINLSATKARVSLQIVLTHCK